MARDSTKFVLGAAVVASALFAAGMGFLFFTTTAPERGEAVVAYAPPPAPKMTAQEIDDRIAEQQALAAKPSLSVGYSGRYAREFASAADSAETASAAPGRAAAVSVQSAEDEGDRLYRRGLYPEALAEWRKMAEAGDAVAAYKLGVEHLDGKPGVVQRDLAEANRWLAQAAQAGEPRAQFEMGSISEYGIGAPRDLEAAARWYLAAAERGHVQGQYNIATMLESGDGIAQDKVEALKWYMLAARGGFRGIPLNAAGRLDSSAPDALDLLMSSLSAPEITEATRRADAFAPRK